VWLARCNERFDRAPRHRPGGVLILGLEICKRGYLLNGCSRTEETTLAAHVGFAQEVAAQALQPSPGSGYARGT